MFTTKKGLYEWFEIPFNLCNSPTMFMRFMNDLLCHFIDSFIIVYLNEILTFTFRKTLQENISHEMLILNTLIKIS